MNEHLEFLSAAAMMGNLQQRKSILLRTLQERKGDIMITGELSRVQNDITELDKVLTNTGHNILAGFTVKYNCKFKYLIIKPKLTTEG